ncbi:hypothetical protein E2C01_063224 [Portunus trituberculatus]|uniref:Uncharacterized protein n=1 Tax=Portunus trituberculatus TaxID=210409 RepID=A0A5B7H8L9_PORTR|nr:hypothetical protein [Portunus trituberculatus]
MQCLHAQFCLRFDVGRITFLEHCALHLILHNFTVVWCLCCWLWVVDVKLNMTRLLL